MIEGASMPAILSKITTTVDGGWKVTFDCAAHDRAAVMELSKMMNQLVQLAAVPMPEDEPVRFDTVPIG